jgi:hypothetical protein
MENLGAWSEETNTDVPNPHLANEETYPNANKREIIYVLDKRSIADLLILEHGITQSPAASFP